MTPFSRRELLRAMAAAGAGTLARLRVSVAAQTPAEIAGRRVEILLSPVTVHTLRLVIVPADAPDLTQTDDGALLASVGLRELGRLGPGSEVRSATIGGFGVDISTPPPRNPRPASERDGIAAPAARRGQWQPAFPGRRWPSSGTGAGRAAIRSSRFHRPDA